MSETVSLMGWHVRLYGGAGRVPSSGIAPDFAGAAVLLAVTIDGMPLDAAGPQLVLPQDRCGARHVSGVPAIRVDGGYDCGRPRPARAGHAHTG